MSLSSASGTAIISFPFNFLSITPLHTVYPFRPISKLNNVALSLTLIFFYVLIQKISLLKNRMNYVLPAQMKGMDIALTPHS